MKNLLIWFVALVIVFPSCNDNKTDSEKISFAKVLPPGSGNYTTTKDSAGRRWVTVVRDTTLTQTVSQTVTLRAKVVDTSSFLLGTNPPPPIDTTTPPPVDNTVIEGGGKDAQGGSKSTDIRHVTSASQFTAAIGSNRQIIFDADVTITGGAARWDATNISYLTVDANGHSVTFDNGNNGVCISLDGKNTHHVIFKGLRTINAGDDGLQILDGAHDIAILNHSSYDNRDGGIDITTGAYNVSIQYSFLGRGNSVWSGAMLIAYDKTYNISVHHNLFAPATANGVGERCPLVSHGSGVVADFRNNIVWKWGRSNGTGSGVASGTSDGANANFVNNYYYAATSASWSSTTVNRADPNLGVGSLWAAGNFSGNGINANAGKNATSEFSHPAISTESPCDAAKKIVLLAGPKSKTSYEQTTFADVAKLPGCGN